MCSRTGFLDFLYWFVLWFDFRQPLHILLRPNCHLSGNRLIHRNAIFRECTCHCLHTCFRNSTKIMESIRNLRMHRNLLEFILLTKRTVFLILSVRAISYIVAPKIYSQFHFTFSFVKIETKLKVKMEEALTATEMEYKFDRCTEIHFYDILILGLHLCIRFHRLNLDIYHNRK